MNAGSLTVAAKVRRKAATVTETHSVNNIRTAIRELSASILLFTSKSKVVSVMMYDLKEEGKWEVISVLGILLLALTFAVVALVNRFGTRVAAGSA